MNLIALLGNCCLLFASNNRLMKEGSFDLMNNECHGYFFAEIPDEIWTRVFDFLDPDDLENFMRSYPNEISGIIARENYCKLSEKTSQLRQVLKNIQTTKDIKVISGYIEHLRIITTSFGRDQDLRILESLMILNASELIKKSWTNTLANLSKSKREEKRSILSILLDLRLFENHHSEIHRYYKKCRQESEKALTIDHCLVIYHLFGVASFGIGVVSEPHKQGAAGGLFMYH